jgi:hypothetical protein
MEHLIGRYFVSTLLGLHAGWSDLFPKLRDPLGAKLCRAEHPEILTVLGAKFFQPVLWKHIHPSLLRQLLPQDRNQQL